jgi:outer membrane protein assembly factor BamB
VLKHGPTYEVLAENTLDDGFDASMALVDNEIYLRGYKYLYAIGK